MKKINCLVIVVTVMAFFITNETIADKYQKKSRIAVEVKTLFKSKKGAKDTTESETKSPIASTSKEEIRKLYAAYMADGLIDSSKQSTSVQELINFPEEHIGESFVFTLNSFHNLCKGGHLEYERVDGNKVTGWFTVDAFFSDGTLIQSSVPLILETDLVRQLSKHKKDDWKDVSILCRIVKIGSKHCCQILAITKAGPPKIDVRYRFEKQRGLKQQSNPVKTSDVIKVKGFYIGMSIKEAKTVLKKRYKNPPKEVAPNQNALGLLLNLDDQFEQRIMGKVMDRKDPYITLVSFKDEVPFFLFARKKTGKVEYIFFDWKLTFNPGAISFNSFVKKFMKAYNIDEMDVKVFYNDIRELWIQSYTYFSPNGYTIVLENNKLKFCFLKIINF